MFVRRAVVASLALVALLATGCQNGVGAKPSAQQGPGQDEAGPSDQQQVETAALFAIAAHFGDSKQLSAMITPEAAAQWADELATIPGSVVNVEQIRFEYPDYLEGGGVVGVYGDLEVLVGSAGASGFMTHCLGEESAEHWHMVTLVESDSGWVVDTIDKRDAVVSLLRMSVAGQACLKNLAPLTEAAKTYRARSQDYTVPASPAALVPEFVGAVPQCPSAGEYRFDDNAVAVCSVHGEYRE